MRNKKIFYLAQLLVLILLQRETLAESDLSTDTRRAFEFFDATCVQNLTNLGQISKWLRFVDHTFLGASDDPAFDEIESLSYFVRLDGLNLKLDFAPGLSCGIYAKRIDGEYARQLVLGELNSALVETVTSGTQIMAMFLVNKGTVDSALVSLVTSKSKFGQDGSISIIKTDTLAKKSLRRIQ
jgi:hypothetical protein